MTKVKFLPAGAAKINGTYCSATVTRVFMLLACHRLVTRDRMATALWPNPNNLPVAWVNQINIYVLKLRRCGVEITTRHGVGWQLT